ncbi:hypothetical protein HanIR_Chr14g0694181 [Helianthus annuus]|nr:hypothetical protein HanIR_Chr14g0694181 [Helianthus annuus]
MVCGCSIHAKASAHISLYSFLKTRSKTITTNFWHVLHLVEFCNFIQPHSFTNISFFFSFSFLSLHQWQQHSPRYINISDPYVAKLVQGRSTINNPKTINSSSWNILHTHSEISWRGGPKPSQTWVVRHHREL